MTVITGPPCSGKSTYARTHAKPGDIVIDFDTLCQALGSPVPHDHPDHVRAVAITMRRFAINAAVREHKRGATVWIVDSNIRLRRQMYEGAGAEIVVMGADKDELHKRADTERPELWHELIDRWTPDSEELPVKASRRW